MTQTKIKSRQIEFTDSISLQNLMGLISSGSLILRLGDAAGTYKIAIQDSNGVSVLFIDSEGNLKVPVGNNFNISLGDAGGANAFNVQDSGTNTVFSINSDGIITASLVPMIQVYNTTNISVNSASDKTITFDTEVIDTDGGFTAGDSKLIAKRAGRYFVSASVGVTYAGTSSRYAGSIVRYNSANSILERSVNSMGLAKASVAAYTNVSWIYNMNVDDYCIITVYQDSGSAVNTLAVTGVTDRYKCSAVMVKIA